jgi:5-methylthioadenosine/S-adenosylhomocysteine deaminase
MIRCTMLLRIGALLTVCSVLVLSCGPRLQDQSPEGNAAAAVDAVDLLIHNGTVLTLDDADTIIESGAVAVRDGRIVAVGLATELERDYPTAQRVSAHGGIILPGLINAHTHAPMVLFRGLADDLDLMDWLEGTIFPAEARHVDAEFVRWGTRMACLEMLRGGTTTFADMYYFEDVIAEVADECGMRAVVAETLIDFPAPDNKSWDEAIDYTRAFVEKWRGHPRVIPAVAPHAAYTVSGEHLVQAHDLASELRVPLLTHVAEAPAEIEQVVEKTGRTTIQYLEDLGILDERVLAAHVVLPSPADIDLLAHRGVGVAHCPQSNMKTAAGVAPVPAMLAAGVAIGLGTDGAASNNDLNLWEEIDTAAKLHKLASSDPTVLDARQALRMATIEGARALGLETEIGSLEVGKRADLIVVRTDAYHQQPHYNLYSLLTYSTKASDVETVVVDGRVVVENGRVLTLDADAILAQVAAYRDRLLSP